jgi:hypothetical protein
VVEGGKEGRSAAIFIYIQIFASLAPASFQFTALRFLSKKICTISRGDYLFSSSEYLGSLAMRKVL